MPDITLCANDKCPLRKRCGRFMGEPDPLWQSFAKFEPKINTEWDKLECFYFWDLKDYPYKLKKD